MKIIDKPSEVKAAGTPAKRIEEFIGLVNSSTDEISIARMKSPMGWIEPGQVPEFSEYTLVLKGILVVETREGRSEIKANEVSITEKGAQGQRLKRVISQSCIKHGFNVLRGSAGLNVV